MQVHFSFQSHYQIYFAYIAETFILTDFRIFLGISPSTDEVGSRVSITGSVFSSDPIMSDKKNEESKHKNLMIKNARILILSKNFGNFKRYNALFIFDSYNLSGYLVSLGINT